MTNETSRKTTPVLSATGLVKSYDGKRVVDELDVTLRKGMVLGLLGPNGAGKTTTLRMLYGLIDPEGGTIHYDGMDFRTHRTEAKRWIGVCTQHDTLDEDFSAKQNLFVYAGYFRPRVEDIEARVAGLMDRFGLEPHADKSPLQLSGGFRRRLMIARSIVHEPRILFLDEPTTGLDPKARIDLWELIGQLRAQGMAIILTTHYMDEAERLSDSLIVLAEGRDVARGTPRAIIGAMLGEHVVVTDAAGPEQEALTAWALSHLGRPPTTILGQLHLPVSSEQLALFSDRFCDVRFTVRPPNLDDLFIALSVEPPNERAP